MEKYDRILFTFFGISLATQRRNRTTEIRTTVAMKNKVFKQVGHSAPGHEILLGIWKILFIPTKTVAWTMPAALPGKYSMWHRLTPTVFGLS